MNRLVVLLLLCTHAVLAQKGFTITDQPARKKTEVRYNGTLLTAYCYFDSTEKPILFPVKTLSGITVTRGYPIAPRPGERTDHPHHTGLWLNYESVNGLDFWNNSDAIPAERKSHYGSIRHRKILSTKSSAKNAALTTQSDWVDSKGNKLLDETTYFTFSRNGNDLIIDRKSVLKAVTDEVFFKDIKDGLLAIRVARELELPSQQKDKFIDANGNETEVAALNNEGVTGMYINKEGVKGDAVWSSKSAWVQLYGTLQDKKVSILIIDHPENVGYPSYWHARGYGLFAVNPLGRNIFSNGKETLNLTLKRGETVSFFYRVVIHEGSAELSAAEVEAYATAFGKLD